MKLAISANLAQSAERMRYTPWILILLLMHAIAAQAGAIRNLPGFTNTVFPGTDDGSYSTAGPNGTPTLVPIGFTINFYGSNHSDLYVNNNGNITLDQPLSTFTPFGLTNTLSQIIAPFFADVDTRVGHTVTFGNDTVDGRQAFGVDWINVGYFSEHVDKLNSFQLILINRSDRKPGDFDIEFNYDQIKWETGDASGGVNGFGGGPAVVGFSSGSALPGTSFQLAGSGISGELLDSNPGGLIYGDLNTNFPGRYVIPIINLGNTNLGVGLLSQGDPRWAANSYGNSTFTIQQKGSALSCLAMALTYAGVPTTPASLNTLMNTDGDFVGTSVNWDAATRDDSAGVLEFHAHRATDIPYLNQTLSAGYPVIVGVNLDTNGEPTHFVLVVGYQNGQYLINDPGHADATTLAYYNNNFESRGYVARSTGNVAGFDIAVGNAAEVLVVDPQGRRTGFDTNTGLILGEIPQSVHFVDVIENSDLTGAPGTDAAHQVEIYQPLPGTYGIYLIGTNSGSYLLALRGYSQNGTREVPLTLQGTKAAGAVVAYQVNYSYTAVTLVGANTYSWSATPTNGTPPLTVQFTAPSTDSAGNTVTSWNWNFGDGSTSTAQNPSHTYVNVAVFSPTLIAGDNTGATVAGYGPAISVAYANLASNGTFETGLFAPWALSGPDTSGIFIDNGSSSGISPHSGSYLTALASHGSPSFLTQTIATRPGAAYLLSFWMNNPDGATPSEFLVSWDGDPLLDEVNSAQTPGWIKLQVMVTAIGTQSVLQFGGQDDNSALGLDDITLVQANPGIAGISQAGTNLVFNVTNGFAFANYCLLASTNLAQPISQWTPLATNIFATTGNFTITATNAVNSHAASQFYLIQLQ